MLSRILNLSVSFVILLHFIGVTQWLSSYSKNKASYITMLSMTEEETKKEKEDGKEDNTEVLLAIGKRNSSLIQSGAGVIKSYLYVLASERVSYQYIITPGTPPPDFTC